MNNLNSVLIEGNLVRDPDLSYTSTGTAVCKFSVANNRAFKKGDDLVKEVSFFDVTTWNRLAEVCDQYLTKGRGVRVVGRLHQERWSDSDGKAHQRVVIVAEHVEFKPNLRKPDTVADNPAEAGADTVTDPLEPPAEARSGAELQAAVAD